MATTDDSSVKAKEYVQYLDRMEEECVIRQDEGPLRDADVNLAFLRGNQWGSTQTDPGSPFRPDSPTYKFTVNMIGQVVKRKTALITDSRPVIDVTSRTAGQSRTARTLENVSKAIWDENVFDQVSMLELVRACAIGSTIGIPTWDPEANFGQGMVRILTYDPRCGRLDPGITKATDVQSKAEVFMIREVVPLNYVREHYQSRGWSVQPSASWSTYATQPARRAGPARGVHSPQAPVAGPVPWRRRHEPVSDSVSPRVELRHVWLRDFQRDARGQPVISLPRIIRYSSDAEGVLLKDERLIYRHGQIPAHIFSWDVELEHPWGIPEVTGLRRIQWTLNRIVGQVMDNILQTNKTRVIGDADAFDLKTWAYLLGMNPQGVNLKKKPGRQVSFDVPQGAIPPFIMQVVTLLMNAIDIVSGMTEVLKGQTTRGGPQSGLAIDALQIQAQSVIRMEARAYESWLTRMFQQVLALIWQYMTNNRLLHIVGPGPELLEFAFNRTQFIRNDLEQLMNADTAWQDFTFRVIPGSSLAMTRIQKGVMAANLYQMGLIAGEDVLVAAEWQNPRETVERARQEMQKGFGPGARTSRKMQKFPGHQGRSAAVAV